MNLPPVLPTSLAARSGRLSGSRRASPLAACRTRSNLHPFHPVAVCSYTRPAGFLTLRASHAPGAPSQRGPVGGASGPTAHVDAGKYVDAILSSVVSTGSSSGGERHELREGGRQTLGDGGHCVADDVNVVDQRTPPRRGRCLLLWRRRDPPLPRLPPPAQAI
jgi:hypothetical protein